MKLSFYHLAFIPALFVTGLLMIQCSMAELTSPSAGVVATNDSKLQMFQEKFVAYQQIAEKINALQKEFEEASSKGDQAKVREIQASAPKLLQDAENAFMTTVPVAQEAYTTSDGQNDELNQFMLTYANYLLTVDNYDDAYKMFALFLQKGMHKTHPEIFEMAGVSAFGSNRFAAATKCFDYAKQTNNPLSSQASAYADSISNYYLPAWAKELQLQKEQAGMLPRVLIRTSVGDMEIELFEKEAPNTVANFITLADKGFYNGLTFHRVLPGFMAQGGCPKGDGTGDPGYSIPEEFSKPNARKHFRGSLAMARSQDPNSAGSQFYISFLPTQFLDGQYTVFGRVVAGMATLSSIERIDPERPYPGQNPTKIIEVKVLRKGAADYSKFRKM